MSYQTPSLPVKPADPLPQGRTEWTSERLAALRIVCAQELGSRTMARYWTSGASAKSFVERGRSEWLAAGCTKAQCDALERVDDARLDRVVRTLEAERIAFFLPWDTGFPACFQRIADPPRAIFLNGAPWKDEIRIAIVGTRKMTSYGKRATDLIAGELAESGFTIVSGLAMGVDARAHEACVEAGGKAVAVLPSGVDRSSVVPRTNLRLADRILASGGTLLSELAPGAPTFPFTFLHRNRLISGCADVTVVVEADRDSGSLVTARLALEEGRDVLAVPGPIWSATSRGTHELIKNGAKPCTSAADVLESLGYGNPEQAKRISNARSALPVSEEEQCLLERLTEPMDVDDLSRSLSQPVSSVGALLSMLELKGRVVSVGPKKFMKNI